MKKILIPLLALSVPPVSQAALLVYEDFDYGLANGATMSGVATNATGLAGNYSLVTTGSNGASGSANYKSTGLSFGSSFLTTNGGALTVNAIATTGNGGTAILGASLNVAAQTGTLYNSYLVQINSRTSAGTGSLRINTGVTTGGGSSYFQSNAKAGGGNSSTVSFGTSASSSTTTNLVTDATYLFVNSFVNVGTTLSAGAGAGVATTWIFTLDGYESWLENGDGTTATMGAYDVASFSQSTTSSSFVFSSTRFLQLAASTPPLPEPSLWPEP
ncbi:MAG: hypothetical protein K0R17_956 [Rariglobus sp.]|nr:hypothetical protein [Rariglobus sp.]